MLKVAPHETSTSRRVGQYRYYHRKSCLLNGWSLLLLISSAVLVHIDNCKVFICRDFNYFISLPHNSNHNLWGKFLVRHI